MLHKKNTKDLISVIIPYYKKKKYVKETIKSVLNQTHQNFEIIIIYDDLDLQDLPYLNKIKNFDKRINLIINNKNMGAGMSRNTAINYSKGDFIAFLDSDDIWKKNKLENQIKFMKQNSISVCHTSYYIINKQKKIINTRSARNFYEVKDLLKSCDIGLSTVIISKKIKELNLKFPNLKTKEDFVLWLSILKENIPIMAYNKTLSYWRKLDDSLSTSVLQKLFDAYKVYNRYMNFNIMKSLYYVFCLSINFLKK
ncbi:glycosyltransferase family 2 protein [Candidatus Pelagibacter sp.]|nr:glycosyltransferase family 2 protein [Candidatus Pelagibacter sp.]